MQSSRYTTRLLSYAESCGAGEALVGDLMEEIGGGRSHVWVCTQLIGLSGVVLTAFVRRRARLSPPVVALALFIVLAACAAIGSIGNVVVAWLAFYYLSGMLSLFAHMVSRAVHGQDRRIADPESH